MVCNIWLRQPENFLLRWRLGSSEQNVNLQPEFTFLNSEWPGGVPWPSAVQGNLFESKTTTHTVQIPHVGEMCASLSSCSKLLFSLRMFRKDDSKHGRCGEATSDRAQSPESLSRFESEKRTSKPANKTAHPLSSFGSESGERKLDQNSFDKRKSSIFPGQTKLVELAIPLTGSPNCCSSRVYVFFWWVGTVLKTRNKSGVSGECSGNS